MALNIESLKAEIITEFEAINPTPADAAQMADFAEALATAIVNHITANGEVTVSGGSSAGTFQVV